MDGQTQWIIETASLVKKNISNGKPQDRKKSHKKVRWEWWYFIHDLKKKKVADQFHEILQSLEICRNADQLYSCLDSDPDYSMKGSVSDLDLVFRRRYQPDPVFEKNYQFPATTIKGKKNNTGSMGRLSDPGWSLPDSDLVLENLWDCFLFCSKKYIFSVDKTYFGTNKFNIRYAVPTIILVPVMVVKEFIDV